MSHKKKPETDEEKAARKAYKAILEEELFTVEKQSQQQAGWFMVFCLLLVYVITLFQSSSLQTEFRQFIDLMALIMTFWFVGNALLIRQGYYHYSLKYINIVFQITMVSFFIMVSARMMGAQFALSSVGPLFYVVVIGVSSLTMNPLLCLLAGGFAAGQLFGMYTFWFHDQIYMPGVEVTNDLNALYGWVSMVMRAVVLLIVGVAAMLMARKARSLLETVVTQVRYEEQLNFFERDLRQAAEVQKQLIPTTRPDFPRLEIESWYQPSKEVGGDYIDFLERSDTKKMVVIGDVSGKGFSGAMLMSNIQAMVQVLVQQNVSLEKIVAEINRLVIKNSNRGRFISLVCFEFDPESEKFRYINCGHNPPLLIKQSGEMINLDANGPVLGVTDDEKIEAITVDYCDGDIIFAYTDGLSELRNEERELFGEKQIEFILGSVIGLEIDEIKNKILDNINEFRGIAALADDLSFLIIKRKQAAK